MDVSSVESQAELVANVTATAKHRMLAMCGYSLDEITELMLERMSTIGYTDYKDKSFNKTVEQLRQECLEEFADALFYCCVIELLMSKE